MYTNKSEIDKIMNQKDEEEDLFDDLKEQYGTNTLVNMIDDFIADTEIEDTDWSKLSKTEDNRITLITCVRNVPTKRYCVQAVEI